MLPITGPAPEIPNLLGAAALRVLFQPSGPISLDFGNNILTGVVVSADTTASKTYTLTVARNSPVTVVNTAV